MDKQIKVEAISTRRRSGSVSESEWEVPCPLKLWTREMSCSDAPRVLRGAQVEVRLIASPLHTCHQGIRWLEEKQKLGAKDDIVGALAAVLPCLYQYQIGRAHV